MIHKFIVAILLMTALPTLQGAWRAGAAKVNITPSYPVRLSGYGNRTTLSEGVKVDIWAKAIAMSWDDGPTAIVMTVDNCGIPASLRDEVLAMLKPQGIDSAHLAICASHTHCAPVLRGALPNLFPIDMPAEHLAIVDRYTNELRDALAKVARDALTDMQAAKILLGKGKVDFAMNRRYPTPTGPQNKPYPEGPTDHELPVLKVMRADGKVRALFTSYACHCTTLSWNFIHPDWAGIAQLQMEMAYANDDAIAMTAIGCGADQNPYPRGTENDVRIHGYELAHEAVRVANTSALTSLSGPLECGLKTISLSFDKAPTEPQLETVLKTTAGKGQLARHATHFLGLLHRHEPIPESVPYIVQSFAFGRDLDMIMLSGEVVVDYSLRLKQEFDKTRLWINGYSNDLTCYIPSERVLKEGGYEGGGAMTYYLRPTKFAAGVENSIIEAVHELVPPAFKAK